VTFGRWILGVALLAVVVVALGAGARGVRRRLAPRLDGPTALLADLVIALAALVVLAEALGVVGLLEAVPLVVGAAALGAGGVAFGRRGAAVAGGGAGPSARDGAAVMGAEAGASGRDGAAVMGAEAGASGRDGAAAVGGGAVASVSFAGAAVVFAAWTRRTLVSLDLGVGGVDSLWYHLPFATKFAQGGSVAAVPYVDLEFLTAFYPANVELLHAVGMVLFGTAALSPLLSLAGLGLGLLAGWCAGRPFGVAPATLLATALVLGVPAMVESQAGEAKNDVFALAFLLAAVALLAAAAPPAAREGDAARAPAANGDRWVLAGAGAAAGLAIGTKLSFLAPIGALGVAVVVLRRRAAIPFVAAAAVTGGYWYVRNLFATGNPLPWLGPLPQPAEARSESTATKLSDYLTETNAWDTYFLPALDDVLGPLWPVLVALGAAGALAAALRHKGLLRALAVVALIAAAAYVVTPSSAAGPPDRPVGFGLNVRYALPALLLGLLLLAVLVRRRQAVLVGALAAILGVTQLAPDAMWAAEHRRKAIALLLLGLAAAAVLTRLRRRPVWLASVAAAAATAVLWPLERDFLQQQYTGTRQPYTSWQAFGLTPVYAWADEQEGARIAVTGTTGSFFQFPLTGRELQNEVQLVGDRGEHGSFTPPEGCPDLAGYTHAVVTPYLDIWDPYRPLPAPELACLRMTGAREVLRSGRVHVFALR
jgi:hypothetical protein